ncbi:hypothetical protein [Telmatospirillum sp.]|uniref:hypothetical protein n=1 Tax=Telmatospirillum sp. TaxID=2079197 RepID=UPI0028432F5D|nr:hypothetical protein [Telmatospirillum sp.]MDR3435866.1 hypothetical protein [Telmatospirillum sp.]
MTAISDYGVPDFLSKWTSGNVTRQTTDDTDRATIQEAVVANPPSSDSPVTVTPALSPTVQATLIANQTASAPAGVPSAAMIVAADILALDTIRMLDSNHNGTLSKAEIAAVSPIAAAGSDVLDTNGDGQLSVEELATATLQGSGLFSL